MPYYSKYDYLNGVQSYINLMLSQSDDRSSKIFLKANLRPPHAIKGQAIQSKNGSWIMKISKI